MKIFIRLIVASIALGLPAACATPAPTPPPPTAAPAATHAPVVAPATASSTPRPTDTPVAETRPAEVTPTNMPAPTTAVAHINPFGILISLNSTAHQNMVKSLGVTYFRPDQATVVENWDGTCAQCDIALQMGLSLILTLRANGGGSQNPSSAPQDMAAYQKTVGAILDKYHPKVLVVENEENSANFYTSTPQEYGAELRAACQVAHGKGIRCANGGMVHNDVALLVWDSEFEGGKNAPACDFAQRALDATLAKQVCGIKTIDRLAAHIKETLSRDKAFLQVYKTSSADYMNFHWYIADAPALGEAADYLQNAVGLPLMSNEMGQQDDSPTTVTNLLNEALALKLPYVVWFSIDPTEKAAANPDKSLRPTALNDPNGTLRPTGEAFQAFIQAHFK